MAEVKPFSAVRYSKENISNLICPPYDVISDEEKKRLQKLSPFNIVNIELSDAKGKKNKYANAADIFKAWLKDGVLKQDDKPAYYFYEQIFTDHGKKMTRRGFFAALKLVDPHSGKGAVKPHEKTLAKPKADRLSLLKAVKANISPIFGLFDDEKRVGVELCKKISKRAPSATAKDKEGTLHKLWVVTDADILKNIEKYLSTKKMFIADGHHRYETAWNYSQEKKAKDKTYSADKAYNYVLTYLCPMEDPGISIWPTHRVIGEPKDLEANIEKYFDVHQVKDFQKLSKKEIQPMMIFKNGKYKVLTIKNESILKKAMPGKGKAYRNLAVSALHYVLIPKIDAQEFTYVKNDKEAVALAKKTGKIAVIVPATPVESLKAISLNNEMMPQKSTYFYPKLASGIVIKQS
ncbi:MAG: DUF1015 domain-containing protein [Endomicrobia bacterium]|nr:DUF1015 domain-containing protein [Endomicrobiia bacterium]MCL2506394.1 DUF1015 domain-containing protein [Endomicrobiia bacterium]